MIAADRETDERIAADRESLPTYNRILEETERCEEENWRNIKGSSRPGWQPTMSVLNGCGGRASCLSLTRGRDSKPEMPRLLA